MHRPLQIWSKFFHKITVTFLQRTFLLISAGMFFCFAQSYNIYFGDLHNHTSLSDGAGTPEDAFMQARNGNADFFAVTDHSWYGDPEWKLLGEAARNSKTATFCGIRGFEMTAGWGHMNVFNTEWYVDEQQPEDFYKLLAKYPEAIAQWNHPDYSETDIQFTLYSAEYDRVINLLEIYNGKRQSFFEDKYQIALDKGWHVGPTANSDRHSASWIINQEYRTAILATRMQRDSLFDALRKHRTYATMNRNLRIFFTINDSIMGSTIPDSSSLLMKISVTDPDSVYNEERIAQIIVYCNTGKIVTEQLFAAHKVDWEYELNQPQLCQGSYYYVKAINRDGDLAITAPVWVDRKKFDPGKPVQPPLPLKTDHCLFDLKGRKVAYVKNGYPRLSQNVSSGVYVNQERKGRTAHERKILFMQSADSRR